MFWHSDYHLCLVLVLVLGCGLLLGHCCVVKKRNRGTLEEVNVVVALTRLKKLGMHHIISLYIKMGATYCASRYSLIHS